MLPGAEEVTFITADGLRLGGGSFPPSPSAGPPRAAGGAAGGRGAGGGAGQGGCGQPGEPFPAMGYPPGRGAPTAAAVLVCNGNGGNRSLRAALAAELSRMGLAVLLFDFRGYGGNPGHPE